MRFMSAKSLDGRGGQRSSLFLSLSPSYQSHKGKLFWKRSAALRLNENSQIFEAMKL